MLAKYGAQSQYGIDIPIAVIGIESKVFTVVVNIVVGIVLGCQPIIGYNIGAGKIDRVKKLYFSILLCTVVVGLISTVLFEAAPRAVAAIFGSPKNIPNPDDYWLFATKVFRIFLSLVTFTCIIKMSSIFFQAVGKPVFAVMSSLIRDIVCFIPLIVVLPIFYGIEGILYAAPIADAVAFAVVCILTAVFMKSLAKKSVSAFNMTSDTAAEAVAAAEDIASSDTEADGNREVQSGYDNEYINQNDIKNNDIGQNGMKHNDVEQKDIAQNDVIDNKGE